VKKNAIFEVLTAMKNQVDVFRVWRRVLFR